MFADQELMLEISHFTPHDLAATLIRPSLTSGLSLMALGSTSHAGTRDMALWGMTYLRERNSVGVLAEIASHDPSTRLRKSASWALMKLGALQALLDSINAESDSNLGAWKLHLAFELQDRASPIDTRNVRVLDEHPYDFTMPLEVEGTVEFKDKAGNWHTYVTGPLSNERLIGNLTPAINANSFDTTLVLQKRIHNINDTGKDHIEGYFLKGLSRQMSENVFRHQYEAISHHDVYRSGVVGDESEGVIPNATASLARVADTHLTSRADVPFPYPHSVRGSFKGFVFMNPRVLDDPTANIDGLLQIISPVDAAAGDLVNGVFQGTFRGVPEDVDNDGTVELNGIKMLVATDGTVPDRHPPADPS